VADRAVPGDRPRRAADEALALEQGRTARPETGAVQAAAIRRRIRIPLRFADGYSTTYHRVSRARHACVGGHPAGPRRRPGRDPGLGRHGAGHRIDGGQGLHVVEPQSVLARSGLGSSGTAGGSRCDRRCRPGCGSCDQQDPAAVAGHWRSASRASGPRNQAGGRCRPAHPRPVAGRARPASRPGPPVPPDPGDPATRSGSC
jgi:hypothetical protein